MPDTPPMELEPIYMPPDVMEAAKTVKRLEAEKMRTSSETRLLCRSRVRVASWALGAEGLDINEENLRVVLSSKADETLAEYRKFVSTMKAGQDDTFWDSGRNATPEKPTPQPTENESA